MKRGTYYLIAGVTALLVLAAFFLVQSAWFSSPVEGELRVGFIYENDESTPYTYNFALAQRVLESEYPDQVKVYSCSNVLADEAEEPLLDLIRKGCQLIFTNSDSDQVRAVAAQYPEVQFCQESYADTADQEIIDNYHTFNAKIFQGRYVSGIAAGMKIRQLLDEGALDPDQALVGFVASYPDTEALSACTAFLLGVRSVAPESRMLVKFTRMGSSYTHEKAAAKALIEKGCLVISQHTHTIGPAVACEEAAAEKSVYHVGCEQSMMDVAPTAALISTRINWAPYVLQAAQAVMRGRPIENAVDGETHGNDVSAGFERGWVEMLDLNTLVAAEGTQEKIAQAIDQFKKGNIEVFRGDYLGEDLDDPQKTYDLRQGYAENKYSSYPTYRYVLRDVITVVD